MIRTFAYAILASGDLLARLPASFQAQRAVPHEPHGSKPIYAHPGGLYNPTYALVCMVEQGGHPKRCDRGCIKKLLTARGKPEYDFPKLPERRRAMERVEMVGTFVSKFASATRTSSVVTHILRIHDHPSFGGLPCFAF